MPTFEIETPGGKVLTIEAADAATAMRGATQWHSENNPPDPASAELTAMGTQPSAQSIAQGIRGFREGMDRGFAGNLSQMPVSHAILHPIDTINGGWSREWDKNIAASDAAMAAAPVASTAGTVAGGLAMGAATAPAAAYTPASGALPVARSVASYLLRNAGLGAAQGALEGSGSGRLDNAALGAAIGGAGAAIVPAVVGAGQGLYNLGKTAINSGRQFLTQGGQQGLAGEVLRTSTGSPGALPEVAASPIPGMGTTATQATQSPVIAAMEDTLAPAGIKNGRTPAQQAALAEALIGKPGGNPEALVNQASAQGSEALGAARDAMKARGVAMWTEPQLQQPLGTTREEVIRAAQARIPHAPDEVRAEIRSSAHELPENPTIREANQFRSDLLTNARTAAKAIGDPSKARLANAYEAAAGGVLDHIEASPVLAGRPANPGTLMKASTDAAPAIPADPETARAYGLARGYTREQAGLVEQIGKRYPQVAALMHGDETVNPDKVFRSLFDISGGSGTGPQRIQEVQDFLYRIGTPEANAAADKLAHAAQRFVRNAVYNQGRTGTAMDNAGNEVLNLGNIAETIRTARQWVPKNPMTAPIAGDLDRVAEGADLLGTTARLRERNGSQTFERAKMQQMIAQLVGQGGGQGLLAPIGAYAGYKYGPDQTGGVPNALAGAALASRIGSKGGAMLAHMAPGTISRPVMAGVETELAAALQNYPALKKAMETQLYHMPGVTDQSDLARALMLVGRTAIPAAGAAAR